MFRRSAMALSSVMLLASTAVAADPLPKVPAGLAPVAWPSDNQPSEAKIELGKQLYFDPRLSKDDTVSCASTASRRPLNARAVTTSSTAIRAIGVLAPLGKAACPERRA